MPDRAGFRSVLGVAVGLTLLVFAARCAWIDYASVEMPGWDQWHEQALLRALGHGQFTMSELAEHHNEHRIFTTRLASLFLVLLSGYWDLRGEMVLSAALSGLVVGLIVLWLSPLFRGWSLLALLLALVAVKALPLSPFNLLFGYQIQFGFLELFSLAALWLVASWEPGEESASALAALCLLAAFLSMAGGVVAAVAATATLAARAAAARSLGTPRLSFLLLLIGIAGFAYVVTPTYRIYAAPSWTRSLEIYLDCMSFPLRGVPLWGVLCHLPLVALVTHLVRRREGSDPAWTVAAFGSFAVVSAIAISVRRGLYVSAPAEQHYELFALVAVWNVAALSVLVDRIRLPAPVRLLPIAVSIASLGLLGWHSVVRSWPTLKGGHEAASIEARFARSVQTGDWSEFHAQTDQAMRELQAGEATFLYDPVRRYTVPPAAWVGLQRPDADLTRMLPPRLGSGRAPALSARFLRGVSRLWSLVLLGGLVLTALSLRRRVATTTAA